MYIAFVVDLFEYSTRLFCRLTVNIVALEQWFSTRVNFASQGTLAVSRDILVVTARVGRDVCTISMQWREARNAAKCITLHRTAILTPSSPSPPSPKE